MITSCSGRCMIVCSRHWHVDIDAKMLLVTLQKVKMWVPSLLHLCNCQHFWVYFFFPVKQKGYQAQLSEKYHYWKSLIILMLYSKHFICACWNLLFMSLFWILIFLCDDYLLASISLLQHALKNCCQAASQDLRTVILNRVDSVIGTWNENVDGNLLIAIALWCSYS